MKIGIVGTGNMGRTIGLALAKVGHEVFFGARNIDKAKTAADLSAKKTQYGTNQESAEFGEVIYYNPRLVEPKDVLSNITVLNGKIVIDSNNGPVPEDFSFEPIIESQSEILQEQIPNAKIVKAFNTMAQEVFEAGEEELRREKIACFVASDYVDARKTVMELTKDMGFDPIDCGNLRQARLLESAADLIRLIMASQKNLGATFSIRSLNIPEEKEYGGRQGTNLS